VDIELYRRFFFFFDKLGMKEELSVFTNIDNLEIRGFIIKPILTNENNGKLLIFCHGLTNNQ
jgi:hypothetical protein